MWQVVLGMGYLVCGMWYVVCGMWYVVCGMWRICVGQGMKVLMVQFIKGSWRYGELEATRMLGEERFEILPMEGILAQGGIEY